MEKEKRVRGCDGREEVSLTRQIGDQKYKVITKKDNQTGVTDTTEELINLDEGITYFYLFCFVNVFIDY